MEAIITKLVTSLTEPVSLVLLLAVYVLLRLFESERNERREVQKRRDEISSLYHAQSEKIMTLLEAIRKEI
jgi:hypothetical protein